MKVQSVYGVILINNFRLGLSQALWTLFMLFSNMYLYSSRSLFLKVRMLLFFHLIRAAALGKARICWRRLQLARSDVDRSQAQRIMRAAGPTEYVLARAVPLLTPSWDERTGFRLIRKCSLYKWRCVHSIITHIRQTGRILFNIVRGALVSMTVWLTLHTVFVCVVRSKPLVIFPIRARVSEPLVWNCHRITILEKKAQLPAQLCKC